MADKDLVGQVLHGTYRVTRKMAQGGMGTVYEASHVKLTSKRYAIKILHQYVSAVADVYQRFLREANIAADLGHPNIVNVTDFQETAEGLPYMVMEYLEGEDMGALLAGQGRLEPAELMGIVRPVGSALQAAHDQGIVHRDIKPENIFLASTPGGTPTVKVLDFGISKIRHSKSIITKDLAILGTPQYMSPEQGEGDVQAIDHTTDIFALGIICYQALSGVLPFDGPSLMAVVRAVCDKPHRPPSEVLPSLGGEVDRVLGRALSKAKQDRHQRVGDFVDELEQALDSNRAAAPAIHPMSVAPVTAVPTAQPSLVDPQGPTLPGMQQQIPQTAPNPGYFGSAAGPPSTYSAAAGEAYSAAAGQAAPPLRRRGLLVPLVLVGVVLFMGAGALTGALWWGISSSTVDVRSSGETPGQARKVSTPGGEVSIKVASTRGGDRSGPVKAAGVEKNPAGDRGQADEEPTSGDLPTPGGVPTRDEIQAAVKREIQAAIKGDTGARKPRSSRPKRRARYGAGTRPGKPPQSKSPKVRIIVGRPVVRGALDSAAIRQVIRRKIPGFRRCYRKGLRENPDLYGRVVIQFSVAARGQVVQAVIQQTTMTSSTLDRCLVKAARQWVFPRPKDGNLVVVSLPLVLRTL